MSSEARVVSYLLTAVRSLRSAEDEILADTEYLREPVKELLEEAESLFDKLRFEHALLETQEVLHGRRTEITEGEDQDDP